MVYIFSTQFQDKFAVNSVYTTQASWISAVEKYAKDQGYFDCMITEEAPSCKWIIAGKIAVDKWMPIGKVELFEVKS